MPEHAPSPAANDAGRYVLFTGRLVADKGVDVFLEAAKRSGVTAVVAGDGPLRSKLEADFPDVRFLGHLGQDALQALIVGATCCVVPSRCLENAPLSILEPMALGRPVIATNTGGVPEIVDDGVTGLLVPRDDPAELAIAMDRVVRSPEAETMGIAARERVKSLFTLERHMDLLLDVYREVLS